MYLIVSQWLREHCVRYIKESTLQFAIFLVPGVAGKQSCMWQSCQESRMCLTGVAAGAGLVGAPWKT